MQSQDKPIITYPTDDLPGAFELVIPSIKAIGLNFLTFFLLTLIQLVIGFLFGMLFINLTINEGSEGGLATALRAVAAIFGGMVAAGLVVSPFYSVTQFNSAKGIKVSLKAVFKQTMPVFIKLIALRIVLAVAYFAGLLMLVFPFFIFWQRTMLARYYIIEHRISVADALAVSSRHAQTYTSSLWGLVGVRLLLCGGGIVIGIGFILDLMYSCAPAIRYTQISKLAKD